MRFILIVALVLLTVTNFAKAQTPATLPSSYSGSVNYLRVWEPVKPYASVSDVINIARTTQEVKQSTQYIDGLGRPIQTVLKNGSLETVNNSNIKGDLVMPVVYDDFGRERLKYMPYASSTATDGNFKTDPFTEQVNFYNTQLTGQTGETNVNGTTRNWAYSKTNFETSPLNRVEAAFAPGANWVGSETATIASDRHPVKMKYWINTTTDAVRIWNVTDVTDNFGTYATTSTYNAGELYKNGTEDEHGKQVIEFKDKEGKIILKKVQLTASAETTGAGSDHSGWICTYYIYDDLNNLRAVIQPEAVKALAGSSWSLTTTLLDEQTFRYEYDHRNRMIMKKVPGAGEVFMIYDARDRLVMVQDANMHTGTVKWMVTKYDGLNRPTETGLLTDSTDVATHRTNASSSTSYPSTSSGYEQLTLTAYDNYSTLPSIGLSSTYLTTWDGNFAATSTTWPYPQMPTQSSAVTGMVTWTKVKVLNSSSDYIYTVMIYDEKGRVIQAQSKNDVTGGVDVVTTQYSWSGQPLVNVRKQQITGTNAQTHTLVTKMDYDELGRVKEVKKKINADTEKIIAKNEYDKLGQLKNKKLATYYSGGAIETLNYDYNIRGWMLGMNRDYARDANSTNYFGFDLGYDKTSNNLINNKSYAKAQFNGNIGGMLWKSKGDGEKRKYDFDYDAVNRLMRADFTQYTDGDFNQTAGVNFNVKMGDGTNAETAYDANGNIKRMQQWGLKLTSSEQIDDLRYAYELGTNKLRNVIDFNDQHDTRLGDFRTSMNHPQKTNKSNYVGSGTGNVYDIVDYTYDANGNLKKDLNKDMGNGSNDGIVYNHLNLPSVVTIRKADGSIKGTITYTYDAAGNKLKKVVDEYPSSTNGNISTVTTTMYIGGFVYESKVDTNPNTTDYTNKLQFGDHDEGRIRAVYNDANAITGFAYDYMLKDHLGNVRMVLTDELQNAIYPVASVEDATVACENAFYAINSSKVVAKPSHDPNGVLNYQNNNVIPAGPCGNGSGTNAKMYRLFATSSGADTGLSMTLKVMSGDVINIWGKSFYNDANSSGTNYTTTATQLIAGFLGGGLGGATASGHGATPTLLQNNTGTVTGINSFITDTTRGSGTLPRAHVNWVLFDEQFKFVTGSFSRVDQAANTIKDHRFTDVPITKNGYLYIYVSNESPVAVFFDNLQVVHTKGPILEETHYYPFGLPMAGISSKALAFRNPENKIKFNGAELNTDFDLNQYEFFYRNYDPQIGRWHSLDTKPTDMVSLYAAMANNPIRYADPLGDTLALFRPDGTFWKFQDDGKKEFSGMFYQNDKITSSYTDASGVQYDVHEYSGGKAFEFNDPGVDVLAIKNGKIDRIEIMSDATVEKQIDRSGVKDPSAQANPMSYAKKQGTGKMDYGTQGIMAGDLKPNTFYLRENHAYNVGDIGNYLWGRGMAQLGVQLGTASLGAHYNNMFHGKGQKTPLYDFGPGTYGKPGLFDSQGDQRAISRGFLSTPKGVALWKKEQYEGWPKSSPR
jgi:RHS repeat-associated protein